MNYFALSNVKRNHLVLVQYSKSETMHSFVFWQMIQWPRNKDTCLVFQVSLCRLKSIWRDFHRSTCFGFNYSLRLLINHLCFVFWKSVFLSPTSKLHLQISRHQLTLTLSNFDRCICIDLLNMKFLMFWLFSTLFQRYLVFFSRAWVRDIAACDWMFCLNGTRERENMYHGHNEFSSVPLPLQWTDGTENDSSILWCLCNK